MIAMKDFSESEDITPALFFSSECPSWAKCVVMNADGTIVFLDTVPIGCDDVQMRWLFPEWQHVRCFYYSRRGRGDWKKNLLIREP